MSEGPIIELRLDLRGRRPEQIVTALVIAIEWCDTTGRSTTGRVLRELGKELLRIAEEQRVPFPNMDDLTHQREEPDVSP